MAGGCNWMIFRVPPNPNISVIPWHSPAAPALLHFSRVGWDICFFLKQKVNVQHQAGKADVFIELLMLPWAGRCWACLKYLHCFVSGFFFFFKSPSLLEMKSLSEVTSGHGNHLGALLDFCLMSIPGVLQHSLLFTDFCLLRHRGPKQSPVLPSLSFGH